MALQIKNAETELSIRCEVLQGCDGFFLIQILDERGKIAARRYAAAWKTVVFRLQAGCYTVCVYSCSVLSPHGVIKKVHLTSKKSSSLCLIFSPIQFDSERVAVKFSLQDSSYPRIIDINGGITVWLHQTTP